MLGISTNTLLLYGIVTAIPTLAWLKWEFFARWKWSRGGWWGKIKELLILAAIMGLGLLTAYLAQSFYLQFKHVHPGVIAATTIFALLPVIIWTKFIYKKRIASLETDIEKRREKWILIIIFVLGTLTVPLLNLYYTYLELHPALNYYNSLFTQMVGTQELSLQQLFPGTLDYDLALAAYEKAENLYRTLTIIIDALLEEIIKISMMIFFVRIMKLVRTIGDAIVFSVLSGLGFAFVENIIFFINVYTDPEKTLPVFLNVVIFRTIILSIGHMTFSGIFGYFYGLSKFALPVYEEERWEGDKFPLLNLMAKLFRTPLPNMFAAALVYEGIVLAMMTHATFNTFIEFNRRDYAVYLVLVTATYVYYLTQRKAGHMILASLGRHRMSLMAPVDENVILELAGMWINEGKYKEVEEICERLEQKDPDNAVVKLLHSKAHDKRRIKRAELALKSLFFQEDIFEEDVSLFEKFKQIREQRGEWKPGDSAADPSGKLKVDPFKKEAMGPKAPDVGPNSTTPSPFKNLQK